MRHDWQREQGCIPCSFSCLFFSISDVAFHYILYVPRSGDLFIVAAAFFWSLGNVLMRKTLRDSSVSGEVVSLFKPVVGIPFLLVLIAFADWYPEPLKTMFSEPWLDFHAFGYAGLAGSLAALLWIFLYRALKIAESAYVSMLGMATPVLVALFAVLFLNERLSVAQMIGGVLILASGIVAHLTARAKSL